MNPIVLKELILKWESNAVSPTIEDGSDDAKLHNAMMKGQRQAFHICAVQLQSLIDILCDVH
jgi:hypothetical protein